MLEKLTPKQERIMYETRDWWINFAFDGKQMDEEDKKNCREGIDFIYKICGLSNPKFYIFLDSPLGLQIAFNVLQVSWQVSGQVRGQVSEQVSGQVRWQVSEQVSGQVRGCKIEYCSFACVGFDDYGWQSFYDFFTKIGILENDKFSAYCKFIKSGIYDCLLFKDVVLIAQKPLYVKRENNRMHSTTSPSIEWADGYKLWYLHGIHFDYELWERIVKRTADPKEILQLENQEQKSAAMRVYGYERILKELQAKSLGKKSLAINGKIEEYETLEVDLKDDSVTARFVKVICWSTGKTHLLRVDPHMPSTKNPIGALAWTAGLESKEEYILMKET